MPVTGSGDDLREHDRRDDDKDPSNQHNELCAHVGEQAGDGVEADDETDSVDAWLDALFSERSWTPNPIGPGWGHLEVCRMGELILVACTYYRRVSTRWQRTGAPRGDDYDARWSALACGPPAMVAEAATALLGLGMSPGAIQAEGFE